MVSFKNENDKRLMLHLHPLILMVLFDVQFYLSENYNYNLTVTSALSDSEVDKELGRESSTHRTGRAIDLRSRDMNEEMIIDLVSTFNDKYKKIAAVSNRSGIPTLIIVESSHLHLQINKRYALPEVNSISDL